MRFPRLVLLGALSSAGLAACGGGPSSGSGGSGAALSTGSGMPSDDYPAPHAAPPQVKSLGGPVLAAPRIVPVFFSNEDAGVEGQLLSLTSAIGATPYWAATTAEYGVGAATATEPVDLAEAAAGTIDESEIATWLQGKLDGDDPAFPVADANTVYVLHYPAGVTVTRNGTSQSCVDFGGYHANVTLDEAHGAAHVAYAVVPRCQSFGGLSGIDVLTVAESHEILEAATDPYPLSAPAHAIVDDASYQWSLALGGGETADLCASMPGTVTQLDGLPFTVQRAWSNAAALAGHHPCVPAPPGEVYFNAAPVLEDDVPLYLGAGQSVKMKGVKIPVGEERTIDLRMFSDGDTHGPWQVAVEDYAGVHGGPPLLSLSLDRDSGQNGETLRLSIRALDDNVYKAALFVVRSTRGEQENVWIGVVGN